MLANGGLNFSNFFTMNYLGMKMQAFPVRQYGELMEIISLQRQYLRGKKSREEESDQGFLTVEHSLETLTQMHEIAPSIIARNDRHLAGYALTMPMACRDLIPVLFPMFDIFLGMTYEGRPMLDYNFYVMGQICVAAEFRGKGVFDLLYRKHCELFQNKFDFIVTEIATRNTRSLKAHQRVGFRPLHIYKDSLDEWAVVIWDWRKAIS
jgi:ribosomal protein S18 acetylase RimI-like enzyme